jgi:tight adherence protein B
MRVLRFIAPALVAVACAVAATPVLAADDSEETAGIDVVEAGSALFPDRAYVLTFPDARGALAASDLTVTEDGKPVTNVGVQSAAAANGIGTVLLIDASNSMKGSIDSAMAAARAFTERNPGQPLSILFFNAKPTVALPLTTDRDQVRAALAKPPKLAEGTHIYDALAAAVAQVRGSALGAARIVLLSDGDDVGSATSLDSALQQLDEQNIRVYTVGIESGAFSPDDLETIADKTGGEYASAASPEELTEVYEELGFRLGNEYLVQYRSTAAPDQEVDVAIAVDGVAEPVSFSYTSPNTGTSAPYQPAFRDQVMQSWVLLPLLVLLVIGLVFLALRFFWNLRTNKALVARLGDFVTLPSEENAAERRKQVDQVLAAAAGQKQKKRSFRWVEGFAEDVDVAQIDHDPRRMLAFAVFVGLLLGILVGVAVGPLWFVVAAVCVPVALNMYVRNKARRQRNEFAEQLPENLDVLASALRAGHSLASAMSVVADEAPEPSAREFTRVVTDEQLGIPLDEALEVTAKRMQNTDMDQVAVLALVQREAGGNTAEVLDQVIANIRARMDLRRMVTVLTAQGKFSAWIIVAVPIGLFIFIALINPDQLDPLFNRLIGQVFAVSAVFMVILGFIIIRKIVSIEL